MFVSFYVAIGLMWCDIRVWEYRQCRKRNEGNNSRKYAVVYECCVVDCQSNYAGEERITVFSFPKEESLRKIWIKFVNRKDKEPILSSFICIKHFEEKYYRKN